MKVIDLFSGIGGFSLGLESTGGFETVQFVENNKWCQKVLAKNFPNVPITGDIKNYEPKRSERIGLVCGGFPCQPFSVAGKRKGTEDDRHLWPEMLRIIKSVKPKYIIGENVRNLTSIQEGMVFEQVCTDLENEGYEVQSFVIPASAVNAPHQRYRVWIVAYSDSRLCRGGRAIEPSGENKDRELYSSQEEQTRKHLRSKTIRRNSVRGETENVENPYDNGQQRGLSKTRYQTFTGQRSKIIRRNGANMFGGSSNDGRNYAEPTVNGAIQRSCYGNKTESTEPRSVCGVSEESNNDKNTLGENRHQENHDRTLVQEGQIRVQPPINRGLGEDKATFKRNKIRSGDDADPRNRVETTENVADTNDTGDRTPKYDTKREGQKINKRREGLTQSESSRLSKDVCDSNSKGLQGHRESDSKYEKTYTSTGHSEEQQRGMDHERFSVEPRVGRVAHGISNRVDRIKGLGNAIVPQIAYQIGMAILEAENEHT
jgi:DNA-cytosine methyltransferase